MSAAPRVHTVAEVAAALRLPYKKTLRLIQDGQIRGHKIGAHWRVPDFELERFLQELVA